MWNNNIYHTCTSSEKNYNKKKELKGFIQQQTITYQTNQITNKEKKHIEWQVRWRKEPFYKALYE